MSATLEAEPVSRFLTAAPSCGSRAERSLFKSSIVACRRGHIRRRLRIEFRKRYMKSSKMRQRVAMFWSSFPAPRKSVAPVEISKPSRHDMTYSCFPCTAVFLLKINPARLRPANRRKVVLATNIAETSLTIDGVDTVIDSGLTRVAGYDPQRGRSSRTTADQQGLGHPAGGPCGADRAGSMYPALVGGANRRRWRISSFPKSDGSISAVRPWRFIPGERLTRETLAGMSRRPSKRSRYRSDYWKCSLCWMPALFAPSAGNSWVFPLNRDWRDCFLPRLRKGESKKGRLLPHYWPRRTSSPSISLLIPENAGPVTQGPSDLLIRLDLLDRAEDRTLPTPSIRWDRSDSGKTSRPTPR